MRDAGETVSLPTAIILLAMFVFAIGVGFGLGRTTGELECRAALAGQQEGEP